MADRAFTTFSFTGDRGVSSRTSAARAMDIINVDEFYPTNVERFHDGRSHPLSDCFGTLADAQAVYPFATSLTQQIDYCACKLASNTAFGADSFEHAATPGSNKRVRVPAGRYMFGDDTWLIRNLASGMIEGDGKLATVLTANKTVLAFDGVWYSDLSNFSIQAQTSSAVAALDIDGNVPGHPYTTRGVQGITLRNIYIDGGNSTYAFAMCRQGGSGAQGSECLFENVHLSNASFACYYQNGFNSLANTFVGGNFQSYLKNGIYVTGGTIAVINTGFQSTVGYKQIENDGWDIHVGSSGAYEGCVIYGCRTESLRFLLNEGAVSVDIRGCAQNVAVPGWFANTSYGAAAASYKAIVENGRLYVATTAGTTGPVKPVFPSRGAVVDGTVVWTYTPFNMIDNRSGSIDRKTLRVTAGDVYGPAQNRADTIVADLSLTWFHEVVVCDATRGPITITMPLTDGGPSGVLGVDRGRQITIKKSESSANPVIISGPMEGGARTITLTGGSRGYVTLVYADERFGGERAWQVISKG